MIGERHLSTYSPTVGKPENIRIVEFLTDVERFIGDYLRGIAEFEWSRMQDGYVSLCAEHTAFLLRLLAEDTPFGAILKIRAYTEDGFFIMKARLDSQVEDEDLFMRASAYASRSGFTARRENGEITLRAKASPSLIYSVYARSRNRFYNMLVKVFFG